MQPDFANYARQTGLRTLAAVRRWRSDEGGFTAVEFAIVAMPFVMLLFGILSVCLFFFTNFTLENAVWQAGRAIRTGQFQTAQGAYSGIVTLEDRKKAFKKELCNRAPPFFDCEGKAVILVQSTGGFGGISDPKCSENGTLVEQAQAAFDAGGASSVVLITVCYPWDFGGKLPFFKLGNLSDGAVLLQSSVAFRTEPYN